MTIEKLIKNDSTIQGVTVHHKYGGYEWWKDYDSKGNEIYFEDSTGYERWSEYDSKGNEIHYRNSDGYEWWSGYDSKGNMTHYRNSNGIEFWHEYDSKGNVIHFKHFTGHERWYDSEGNEIEDPNKIRELTLEEIAEKIGIPVENLRIKD